MSDVSANNGSPQPPLTPAQVRDMLMARFIDVFGAPHQTTDGCANWSVHRADDKSVVNVLAITSTVWPKVWVFDPLDRVDGFSTQVMTEPRAIDGVIEVIRTKLSTPPRRPPTTPISPRPH